MREITAVLVCMAVSALLLIAYYFPQLAQGRQYFVSDHTYFFEPFAGVLKAGYSAFKLPLWNPYIYCGSPQVANPSPGLFYFPNFFFVAFPYSQALALILLFQQLLAFLSAYLLARLLRFSTGACCFVGISIAMSGYFFSLTANYTLPATFAWGMLSLFALASIAREKHRLAFVTLAAFAIHWMLMAGRPEIYVPCFVMLGFLALLMVLNLVQFHELTSADLKERLKVAMWQALSGVLGILMSTAMLLPVSEWSKLSPRSNGLDLKQVFNWSCNWYDYLCMMVAQPFGDLQQPHTLFGHLVASRDGYYPFLPSAYVGPVVITLMIYGLTDKSFKQRYYAFAAAIVAALLAMGKYGPLSLFVLNTLPFLSILRYPVKLLIFVILFSAILAGGGLNAIENGQRSRVAKIVTLSLWAVTGSIGAAFMVFPDFFQQLLVRFPTLFFPTLGKPVLITSIMGLLVSLVIAYSKQLKIDERQTISVVILGALLGSLIVPAFQCQQKTAAPGYFEHEGLLLKKLKKLKESNAAAAADNIASASGEQGASLPPRLLTVYFDPLRMPFKYPSTLKRPVVKGEPYMEYCREMLLPNTSIDWKQPVTFGYESAETKDYRTNFLKALHRSSIDLKGSSDNELAIFCKITATRYVGSLITSPKGKVRFLSSRWFKVIDEDEESNLRLYEVIDRLPRAYIADNWTKNTQEDFFKRLLNGPALSGTETSIEEKEKLTAATDWFATVDGTNGSDEREPSGITAGEAPLPTTPSSRTLTQAEAPENLPANGKVSFLLDTNEHVALSVQCNQPALVVLNDRFYPGWKARIDSIPATIYRANGFMRAVYVSKGSHLIEYDYKPDSLRFGIYIAVTALAITVLLGLCALAPAAKRVFRFLCGQK